MTAGTLGRARRAGLAALEVVFATAVGFPIAAAVYYAIERVASQYEFFMAAWIGCPLM